MFYDIVAVYKVPLSAPALNNKRANKGLHLEPKPSPWSMLRTTTRPLPLTPLKYAAQSARVVHDPPSMHPFLASRATPRNNRQGRISALVLVPPRLHSPVDKRSTVLRSIFFNLLPNPKQSSRTLKPLIRALFF